MRAIMAAVVESLCGPTMMGHLRRLVLIFAPVPLALALPLWFLVDGQLSAPGWTILFSASAAITSLLLCALVQPPPLPEGLSPGASVRRSLHRFRQVTRLRIALPMTAVGVGAIASVIGDGLFPFLVALALGWPQLLLALPSYHAVSRARRSMEQRGSRAYLWAALGTPAPAVASRDRVPTPAAGTVEPAPTSATDTDTAAATPARPTAPRPAEPRTPAPAARSWRPLPNRRPTGGPTRTSRARRKSGTTPGPRTPPKGIQIG